MWMDFCRVACCSLFKESWNPAFLFGHKPPRNLYKCQLGVNLWTKMNRANSNVITKVVAKIQATSNNNNNNSVWTYICQINDQHHGTIWHDTCWTIHNVWPREQKETTWNSPEATWTILCHQNCAEACLAMKLNWHHKQITQYWNTGKQLKRYTCKLLVIPKVS